jgi:hypothetical protein
MTARLIRLLSLLGVEAVPALGYFMGEWSNGTALALYWWENFFGALLIATRIVVHRKVTRKRGHYAGVVTITKETRRGGRRVRETSTRPGSFLSQFLITMLVFTGAHGVFLALILFLFLPELHPEAAVNLGDLRDGWIAMSGFLLCGLSIDLVGIRDRPFSWLTRVSDVALGRMVVVHLTIIGGMFAMFYFEQPRAFFGVFIGLKTLMDLSWWAPWHDKPVPEEPPAWTRKLVARFGPEKDFVESWKKDRERERQNEREAEGVDETVVKR